MSSSFTFLEPWLLTRSPTTSGRGRGAGGARLRGGRGRAAGAGTAALRGGGAERLPHLRGAGGAVEADDVHREPLQRRQRGGDVGAEEHGPVRVDERGLGDDGGVGQGLPP